MSKQRWLAGVAGIFLCLATGPLFAEETGLPSDPAIKEKGLKLFREKVQPLLKEHCGKCHLGDDVEGEFDLGTREALLRGGTSKAAILPGKSADSLLYQMLAHRKKPFMPAEADKLPDADVAVIAEWIDLGAPYADPLTSTSGPPAWTIRKISPEAGKHWAFTPWKPVTPPASLRDAETVNEVDLFVREKQKAHGLTPNPRVAKRVLLRRVYFDLIGLPPTLEEENQFLADESPQAYERLVDRLLASPHYGEKWARSWLDLARFGESHGFEHDYDRPTAYHYRDFVIQAFNQDLPYNTFVQWQLAGDELAPNENLALMATGFLAAGVHSTQITANEVEKHRYDEMDDMLATTGTAMLGLTFGCARCHDHKYDPIPQSDYYRMLATFTTTVRSEVDLDFDPAGYQKEKEIFDKAHAPLVAELTQFEKDALPGLFDKWEAEGAKLSQTAQWLVLDVENPKSAGGTTFEKQPDGSLLATGPKPDHETFTFQTKTTLTGITSLRLEAMAHPSLVKSGPGRADNGNFALTQFTVTMAPADKPEEVTRLVLKNPRATFEQKGLPVAAAIDDNAGSGWAVDPEFGKTHAAAFDLENPIGFPQGTILTFSLDFKNNVRHAIGRPRLSCTLSPTSLPPAGEAMSAEVTELLKIVPTQRTPVQRQKLLDWYKGLNLQWLALKKKVDEHQAQAPKPHLKKTLISSEGLPAIRLHTQGGDFFPDTYFLRRGDPNLKDGVAQPGYLQVLSHAENTAQRWPIQPPAGARQSFRRTAFAHWLTDTEEGAGQLLARVIVNRLWQQHFSRGLVASVSDLGVRGAPPTHPELLDWLAQELLRQGWKLKPLHRLMVLSGTYQQSAAIDPDKLARDPDNQWLWRKPRKRFEAEVIRDSILSLSGLLDPTMFGPGTLDSNSRRRSIYFTVKRSKLIPMLQVFDCPDALNGVGERPSTTIAPQALLLLNNPLIRQAAKAMATRIRQTPPIPLEQSLALGYKLALCRPPTAEELADGVAFVNEAAASHKASGQPEPELLALTDWCQAVLCLNEFVYAE